jgi:hypothetical protein
MKSKLTVEQLFRAAGLTPQGSVPWLERVREGQPGVYVVATVQHADDPGSPADVTFLAEIRKRFQERNWIDAICKPDEISPAKIQLTATDWLIGVLRLRSWFAKRSSYSAQDDRGPALLPLLRGHRATTTVEIPPRGRKSPLISAQTGFAQRTTSSST